MRFSKNWIFYVSLVGLFVIGSKISLALNMTNLNDVPASAKDSLLVTVNSPVPDNTSLAPLYDSVDSISIVVQTPLDIAYLYGVSEGTIIRPNNDEIESLIVHSLQKALKIKDKKNNILVRAISSSDLVELGKDELIIRLYLSFKEENTSNGPLVIGALSPFIFRSSFSEKCNYADFMCSTMGMMTPIPFVWQVDGVKESDSLQIGVNSLVENICNNIKF